MGIVGTICILLAFLYFWYFPFYVSNSISYLATRMKGLLRGMGIKIDTKTRDEAFVLLNSIDLLESRFSAEQSTRRKKMKPNKSLEQSPWRPVGTPSAVP